MRTVGPTHRPTRGAAPSQPPRRRRLTVLVPVVAAVGVLGVVLAALWSLSPAGRSLTAPPGELVVDAGVAHVDRVVSAARPSHAMPGMGSDDDPVAAGRRRVSVDLTLRATGDDPLRFTVDAFVLRTSDGTTLQPHRSQLPESELSPGTSMSGVLVFDVPKDVVQGQLSYGGTAGSVDLYLPLEAGTGDTPSTSTGTPSHADDHPPATTQP